MTNGVSCATKGRVSPITGTDFETSPQIARHAPFMRLRRAFVPRRLTTRSALSNLTWYREPQVQCERVNPMVLPSKMPQLADLDLLLSVESCGSVGKAAQAHSLSQPAASTRISAMERRLGLRLLERSPTGSKLTEQGEMLAKYSRNVIQAARELLEFGSRARTSESKRLRVAGSAAISEHLIPEWLNRSGFSFGEARVEVQTGGVDELHRLILAGDVDVAFVDGWCPPRSHSRRQHRDDLETRYICDDKLAVVVGPGHPWAVRSSPLTVPELVAAPLALRERGSGLREFTDELLGDPQSYIELPSTGAIKQAVATSRRVTVLNLSTVRAELAEGRLHLVAVDQDMPSRPIHAVWSRQRGLPVYAADLMEIAAAKGSSVPVIGLGQKTRQTGSRMHPRPRKTLAVDVHEAIA